MVNPVSLLCSLWNGNAARRRDRVHSRSRAHSLFHKQASSHQPALPDSLPAVYEHILPADRSPATLSKTSANFPSDLGICRSGIGYDVNCIPCVPASCASPARSSPFPRPLSGVKAQRLCELSSSWRGHPSASFLREGEGPQPVFPATILRPSRDPSA